MKAMNGVLNLLGRSAVVAALCVLSPSLKAQTVQCKDNKPTLSSEGLSRQAFAFESGDGVCSFLASDPHNDRLYSYCNCVVRKAQCLLDERGLRSECHTTNILDPIPPQRALIALDKLQQHMGKLADKTPCFKELFRRITQLVRADIKMLEVLTFGSDISFEERELYDLSDDGSLEPVSDSEDESDEDKSLHPDWYAVPDKY